MKFQPYWPCDRLKPYVRRLIISKTADEQAYKILPDTSLVMGFQYRGKLMYLDNAGETPLSTSGVTGLMDTFRVFKNSRNIGSVLVDFIETGAAAFFREPVHEFFGKSLSLDNFIDSTTLAVLDEQLMAASNDWGRINTVEQFLLSRLQEPRTDPLIVAALQHIHLSNGTIRMKELADKLCISQSPLEKRFRKQVGASPKKFSSIVRIKNAINALGSTDSTTRISIDAGYFDQAHFLHDFKRFTGLLPTQFLRFPTAI
ncbi:helix-turn-helix domain-containing protein [Spirosoma endbachense]|uniref:Helix-turn-helix domain-containing protein n=1 Tax=Spirosoma endbachense TaxID=2666025 RepID=A0A6P1W9S7_9BACT|nr:helix-turn-helix domain-containing protein [Spirosoma endbachense]QHW01319.1 helix-turn-helix domain-containing protein [Spirosoma endbachense]